MRHASRVFTTLLAVLLGVALSGSAHASPAASLEQVRNGVAGAGTTPSPTWGTGNAGASNSHYLESHSIAYRTVMTDLPTDGTVIELVIGYDVKRSGSYALDYLTHYQRLLPHVLFGHRDPEVFDPLNGVSGIGATVSTAPIPVPTRNLAIDPDGSDPEPAAPQPSTSSASLGASERQMTLFGGTLLDVTYVSEADPALAVGSSETTVKVRFTADSPTAVLAWGGHIACRWDWGFNGDGTPRSAGGISGSSYHMRLVDWNLGNLGNQDRSMSTDAVFPVPKCGISNLGPFCAGSTNTHTAPEGMETYEWTLFDNTGDATIVGSNTGLSVVVHSGSSGSYGLLLTTGASGFTKQCQASVTVNPVAEANAGLDAVACASSPSVPLAGWVSGGVGAWIGGAGTFVPNRSALDATYTPTAAEIAAGSVTLTLKSTPASGPCPAVNDQVVITITPAATVYAGTDAVVCAPSPQVRLAGVIGGAASSATWSGGTGTFSPGTSALDAIYAPSLAEIAAGSLTLTLTTNDPAGPCPAVEDAMTITIRPPATADAGVDQIVCASAPQVQLAGFVGGAATSGAWSGGGGGFSPNAASLTAVYTPSAAEIAAGRVTLKLTTNDPTGPCPAVEDVMTITIQPAATVSAGADVAVCASSPQAQLAAGFGGAAGGGAWSGGGGTFSPNASAPNAIYTPTAAEIAAGSVTLTYTTNDPAGPCPAVHDDVVVTIFPAATANAGVDPVVCASSPQVQLAGVVGGGASSGSWVGGAGTFHPNRNALGATYTPTAGEIAAGTVTLTLMTNDPAGPCPAVGDAVTITIHPVTTVNAGLDQVVCASSPQAPLAGAVGGTVSTGTWSGGAGTFSPNASTLNATYTPSAAEIAAGSVTLRLTSAVPAGPCPPASDAVTILIHPVATASAGPDRVACAADPTVQLAGSVGGGASSGTWSGGSGSFSPNASTLNATYTPSAGEIAAGSVTLTLTTNDPAGPCGPVADAMKITLDAPVVTVPNRIVCTDVNTATMCANPSKGVAPYTYLWSTGAKTQCITVSDTGSYSVTITDAVGCRASGSGAFRQRECQGQLAHTSTTCASFQAGEGEDLTEIHWVLKDGVITSISPGVFFYWTKITAPRSDFKVVIAQTVSNLAFPYCEVVQDQVSLYDSDCSHVGTGVEMSPGQALVEIGGADPGQVFIISVKYSLKTLVGVAVPPGGGAHYDFRTEIDGKVVDSDPDGLQVGESTPGAVGVEPGSNLDGLALYRPMPNPFVSGMRLAYAVAGARERVQIGVYDLAGRLVRRLADEFQGSGRHLAAWDGRDQHGARMHGGMYFVRIRIGDEARHVRVTFLD